jgi:Asp-tRNA(Asn)/Glu-tRNA(Gln) amidotransferase C subunit
MSKEEAMDKDVNAETIRRLAEVAGIEIPEEDIAGVVATMRSYKAAFQAVEALDLTEVDPVVVTDPRWER